MSGSGYRLLRLCLLWGMLVGGFSADLDFLDDDRIAVGSGAQTPVALAAGPTGSVFIGNRDSGQICMLSVPGAVAMPWASVDRRLHALATDQAAGLLYAAIGQAGGEVVAFELATGRLRWRTVVGHSPVAIQPMAGAIYVACQADDTVVEISPAGVTGRCFPTHRQPVALAAVGAERLLVLDLLPNAPATKGNLSASAYLIDLVPGTTRVIPLPAGSHSTRAVAVSDDRRLGFVPSIVSRSHLPTTQIERGWIQTSALHVLDLTAGTVIASFLLDDPERGAANPWGCVILPGEQRLLIALAGSQEVMAIDLVGLKQRLSNPDAGHELGELRAIRQRISVAPDHGVRALLPRSAGGVWFAAAFSGTVGMIPDHLASPIQRTRLEGQPVRGPRLGEALFHDATLSAQGWLSCASCHPDGGTDGLNWFRIYGGIGSFKNTKSVVGAPRTAPTTWTGYRADAKASTQTAFQHALYREPSASEVDAVLDYLGSLRYQQSPFQQREDPALVERGRLLFTERSCIDCHRGPEFTDHKPHDVGTVSVVRDRRIVTPKLREVWRTAPYLHDGRAQTIEDAIRILLQDSQIRLDTGATEEDIAPLAAYVRTL